MTIWRTEELAERWPLKPLSALALKVGSGATPRGGRLSYPDHGVPLIRSQNVRFDGFTHEGLAFLTDDQAKQLEGVKVEAGDVLLNITGASIGRVCIAPPDMRGARVNQHVCIIRTTDVQPKFLASYLSSPQVQDAIAYGNYGVTREALTKSQILELPVPVPPMQEQQALAAIIDGVGQHRLSAAGHLASARRAVDQFRRAVLAAACSSRLTATWREDHEVTETASDRLAAIDAARHLRLGRRFKPATAPPSMSTCQMDGPGQRSERSSTWRLVELLFAQDPISTGAQSLR